MKIKEEIGILLIRLEMILSNKGIGEHSMKIRDYSARRRVRKIMSNR